MFPEWSRLFLSVPVSWRGKPSCHMQIPGVSNNLFTLSIRFFWFFTSSWDCVHRKTWCTGPFARVDYYSLYLIVNSVVSYPPPLQRERGGVEKMSPIGWAHFHLSANFQKNKIKRRVRRRGREGVRADLMSLNRHFMEHGQPNAWADLVTSRLSWHIKWLWI